MEENEAKHNKIMFGEISKWERAANQLKETNEIELYKKQVEIKQLHEVLAEWIDQYMDLQKSKGQEPCVQEQLLVKTLRHRRNRSNNLIGEIAKAACSGTASKKLGKCNVIIDPQTGQYIDVIGVTGMNCENTAFAPDNTTINNKMI